MNNSIKISIVVIVVTISLYVLSMFNDSSTYYVSTNGCCTIKLTTLDDETTELELTDNVLGETESDVYPTEDIPQVIKNIENYCDAHHH